MVSSVLLSGACGSGKSSILTLGYRAFDACWGPTATFDTDGLFMMVDPRWELAHEERRGGLMLEQCALLAESFIHAGLSHVVIGGNALHTPKEFNPLVTRLLVFGEVFHVTLDPSLSEIQRRVKKRGGDKTPEWLETHVEWMRAKYESWTCRIDNSVLSPAETLSEIAGRISRGEGRLASPISVTEDP